MNIYLKVVALKMDKKENIDIFFKRREDCIKKESDKFLRQGIMQKGK